MRIVYMGTPDFAVPAFLALCENGYPVDLAVTQPDKAKDRGKKQKITPIKEKALEKGVRVIQPESLKNNSAFLEELCALEPDLIVVAAYGKLLPKEILKIPRLGCINIHASLLPKYRGAAPIHRAVIEGEKETGVTLMYMEEGLDTGDMIASVKTPILRKTTESLYAELAVMGAKLLVDTLPLLIAGTNERIPQREDLASYAPMVFKEQGYLDFKKEPETLECLIRGFYSSPKAHTLYEGVPVKILAAEALGETTGAGNGTVLQVDGEGIKVAAGGRVLLITRLQFPGKKAMEVSEYIKGNKIELNRILG